MAESMQKILDGVQQYMEMARMQMYSGPAGSRVLYTLIDMLAMNQLTDEQKQQVETIIDMHDECVRYNGESKNQRGAV